MRGEDKVSGELPQIPEQHDHDSEPEQQLPHPWRPMRPVLILAALALIVPMILRARGRGSVLAQMAADSD